MHEWALRLPVSMGSIIYLLSHPAKTFRWLIGTGLIISSRQKRHRISYETWLVRRNEDASKEIFRRNRNFSI
jgi:hypothetical protein